MFIDSAVIHAPKNNPRQEFRLRADTANIVNQGLVAIE